jgi:putative membrane protein insertion efficiency factor
MSASWTHRIHSVGRTCGGIFSLGAIRGLRFIITIYQRTLSPLLGPRCRFYPSCSAYAKECLTIYPWPKALIKSGRRLLSCHPFHPGGVDLP